MQRWPTLVFLRDGQYVTALSAMRDWDDYLRDVAQALRIARDARAGIGIPAGVVVLQGGRPLPLNLPLTETTRPA